VGLFGSLAVALTIALGYALWQSRASVGGIAAAVVLFFALLLLFGIVPLLIGFTIQLIYRKPVPEVIALVAAVLTIAASYMVNRTNSPVVDGTAPHGWAALLSVSFCILVYSSFISMGAAACRWAFARYRRNHSSASTSK